MLGGHAPLRRAFEKTDLHEKWFVNFFNRGGSLLAGGSEGLDSNWSAAKLIDDERKEAAICRVQAQRVDR